LRWERGGRRSRRLCPGRTAEGSRHRATQLGWERKIRVAWTEAEDEEIRAGVAAGETIQELAKRLPSRTPDAVARQRLRLVGCKLPVTERWTEAEDAALREGFASGKKWKEVAEGLPGRTMKAVIARGINKLGLKRLKRGDSEQPGQ
jgi:hypothetical protein